MRIIILGSGPLKPIPRPNCYCPTCKEARRKNSKSRRTRSSALIQIDNKNILIDASPDFLKQIKREKISSIDMVLITHGHFDAVGGIKKLDRWLNKKIPIYLEKINWKRINKNLKNFKPIFIKPNQKLKIFNLFIIPFRVFHDFRKNFPTLGFKIGKNLVYASDFKKIPSKKYMKGIENVILDGAMYFGKQIFSHQNTAQAIALARGLKVKNLYLTQIGHSYPPYKEAAKEINRYWKKNKGKSKMKIFLTYDGLKFIIHNS